MPLTEWFYNSNTGAVNQLPTPAGEALLHTGLGWHGPFGSKQEALDFYSNGKAANPGWKEPTGGVGLITNTAESAVERATGVSSFNLGAWFIRTAEIMLGLVLIGVGIAKLTGTTNAAAL
jgi:hypothetical protein